MKIIYTFLIFSLNIQLSANNDPTQIDASIKEVIVYQEGAQINRSIKSILQKGKHTLEIISLSNDIIERSIQVDLGNEAVMESISLINDIKSYPEIKESINTLYESGNILSDSITLINSFLSIYENEKMMIQKNNIIKGKEGLTASTLSEFSDFYRGRLMEIERLILMLKNKKIDLQKRFTRINQEITRKRTNQKQPFKKIEIIYFSKTQKTVDISIKYLINKAGWSPSYNTRVTSVTEPLELVYKADVWQGSGTDWNNIKLSLATGIPSTNLSRPVLESYYLTPHNYYRKQKSKPSVRTSNILSGQVTDAYGEPLIGASILEHGTTNGTITDIDGSFVLRTKSTSASIEISYTGFESKLIATITDNISVVLEEGQYLDEVVVTEKNKDYNTYQPKKEKTKYQVPLSIKKNVTQRLFNLDTPYTIKSDRRNNKVTLLSHFIDCDYRYETVPKVEEKAYLVATIKDWHQYDLLSGNMSIFFDGIYQGDYFLDLEQEKENLIVSVGVDNNIKVSRKENLEYKDTNFFGDKITTKKVWEIKISNNLPYAISMHIIDQVPISKSDQIKVSIKELANGELDESTGIVKWKKTISRDTTEKVNINYNVTAKKKDRVIIE